MWCGLEGEERGRVMVYLLLDLAGQLGIGGVGGALAVLVSRHNGVFVVGI